MKLSNLTVRQKFILKLLEENPTFEVRKIGYMMYVCDGQFPLFNIPKNTYENLKILKLL
jgi:hypothetical protein